MKPNFCTAMAAMLNLTTNAVPLAYRANDLFVSVSAVSKLIKQTIGGLSLLAVTVMALTACSSAPPKAQPLPVNIETKAVQIKTAWRKSVGYGTNGRQLQLETANLGDALITVDAFGTLSKLAIPDGTMVWQQQLAQQIIGGVGLGEGMVFVASSAGIVTAFDATSGTKVWQADARSQISSQPVAANGAVAIHTDSGRLLLLDAKTGKERWVLTLSLPALTLQGGSTPVIVGDVVLVGQPNGRVAIVDLQAGELLAEHTVAKPHGRSELQRLVDIKANLILEPHVFYAVTYQGKAAAIDPQTAKVLWQKDMSSYRNMATDYNALYIAAADGHVWSVSKSTGITLWQQKALVNRDLSAPAVIGNYVLVADESGMLFALDKETGEIQAKYQLGSAPITVQPIVQGNKVYVYDNGGSVHALELVSNV